ncbi:MAG: DUF6263 family protein [Pyrinomonadaceae bacterium]
MKILLPILLALFFVSATSSLGQTVDPILRFQPPVGHLFRLTYVDTETDLPYAPRIPGRPPPRPERFAQRDVTDKEVGIDWRIESRDATGNTRIAMNYVYIKIAIIKGKLIDEISGSVIHPGKAISFDTRIEVSNSNPELKPAMENPENQKDIANIFDFLNFARDSLLEAAIGKPFTVVVSPEAKVVDIIGIERLMDDYRTAISKKSVDAALRARQDAMLEAYFGEDQIRRTLSDTILLAMPNRAVKISGTWTDKTEASAFGFKIPVVRTFSLTRVDSGRRKAMISGTRETTLSGSRDGNSIKGKGSFTIDAVVDSATGIAATISMEGTDEMYAFPTGGPETQLVTFANLTYAGKYTIEQLGRLAPGTNDKWTVHDGTGTFSLNIGTGWTRTFSPKTIAGSTLVGFDHLTNDRSIRVSNGPIDSVELERNPLSKRAERILKLYSDPGKATGKLISFKQFKAHGLDWARTNYVVTWNDGHVRTHWNEATYSAGREISFEASYLGSPNAEADAEILQILDSISILAKTAAR